MVLLRSSFGLACVLSVLWQPFPVPGIEKSPPLPLHGIWKSAHRNGSSPAMRTTLNIDDEILEAARSIAGERNLPVGAALSELARRGLRQTGRVGRKRSGFPVFEVTHAGTVLDPRPCQDA